MSPFSFSIIWILTFSLIWVTWTRFLFSNFLISDLWKFW
jgi:hypothetical protein